MLNVRRLERIQSFAKLSVKQSGQIFRLYDQIKKERKAEAVASYVVRHRFL